MKEPVTQYIQDYYYSKVVDIVDHESTRHDHEEFEIYYMKEGSCNYMIDDHTCRVVTGDVILIPGNTSHRTNYGGVPHTRLLVNCSYEYIPASVADRIPTVGYHYRNHKVISRIEELFAKIEYEYSHPDAFSADALKCYTAELFLVILRHKNEHETQPEGSNIIRTAMEYIQNNYMNDVKLSTIAELLSISPEHLSRVFKQEAGIGFKEYLTGFRLQKAEDMLKHETGRAVSEVAYACGFNDGNYFSYTFKKAYGVSPSQVRRKKEE
ncbi:MAG: helix-turn-helix transcriptional regulator [Lachnospiraceae bacterium]|nr:helix-turn-helix transcriptional regulator [Lachnospiraceae bacterium]